MFWTTTFRVKVEAVWQTIEDYDMNLYTSSFASVYVVDKISVFL
jgi:hypothetical protein